MLCAGSTLCIKVLRSTWRSEHETGLTVDNSYDAFLYDDLDETALGIWMDQLAQSDRFIMRFPEGKETMTHYGFEPWHYCYIGVDLAKKIKSRGVTMEEYFNQ